MWYLWGSCFGLPPIGTGKWNKKGQVMKPAITESDWSKTYWGDSGTQSRAQSRAQPLEISHQGESEYLHTKINYITDIHWLRIASGRASISCYLWPITQVAQRTPVARRGIQAKKCRFCTLEIRLSAPKWKVWAIHRHKDHHSSSLLNSFMHITSHRPDFVAWPCLAPGETGQCTCTFSWTHFHSGNTGDLLWKKGRVDVGCRHLSKWEIRMESDK